jgi:NAD(P)-dependent dehydrogenase (short-subunit alcohol dehydrogenase family)
MNHWVLITGSAQRIGRVIALEMAEAGWNVVVHYNTSRCEAIKTLKDIEALGRKACLAELDLANLPLVEKLIPALTAELGPLAALVNNASLFMPDSADLDTTLHAAINAEAPRILSEAFRKQSPHHATGVIVNILDADPYAPDFSLYNASKKALRNMTLDMAMRFAPAVRVNGVAPGPILRNRRQSPQHFRKRVQETPLGKPIAPQAVASAVRFLIEQPALTGAIIPVDGGLHLIAD